MRVRKSPKIQFRLPPPQILDPPPGQLVSIIFSCRKSPSWSPIPVTVQFQNPSISRSIFKGLVFKGFLPGSPCYPACVQLSRIIAIWRWNMEIYWTCMNSRKRIDGVYTLSKSHTYMKRVALGNRAIGISNTAFWDCIFNQRAFSIGLCLMALSILI